LKVVLLRLAVVAEVEAEEAGAVEAVEAVAEEVAGAVEAEVEPR
jgi:hypothetical protein